MQTGILNEINLQLTLAFPVIATSLLRKSIDFVSFVFVGHFSGKYISSVGLATVSSNVTGNSLIIGLSGALSTLCSQANGAKDYKLLGLALQRGLIILYFFSIPVSLLWSISFPILTTLGQSEAIASEARNYLCLLIPGLWGYTGSICIQTWIFSQQKTMAVAIITLIVAIIHPFLIYLFMYTFGFGYLGAAIAVSTSRCLELSLYICYLKISNILIDTEFELSKEAFYDWGVFLKLGIPSLLMVTEWWASEAVIFMSGILPNPSLQVASMSLLQNIDALCFMIPTGLKITAAMRVGNSLGADDSITAKIAGVVAPVLACVLSFITAILILIYHSSIGYIFTNDVVVVRQLSKLLYVFAGYVIADALQCTLTGVMYGVGKQNICGKVVLFSYYIIGIPLAAYFSFDWGLGLGTLGLSIGIAIATWTHMLLYFLAEFRIDWDSEIDNTRKRLGKSPRIQKIDPTSKRYSRSYYSDILSYCRDIVGNNNLQNNARIEYELVQTYTNDFEDDTIDM